MTVPTSDLGPEPTVFDPCGPLPTGTTLIEASAGTGKTWTVGALVTRFVAEGRARLDEMLVITFSRAASQELRERVRAQLVAAERALAAPAAADRADPLTDLLVSVSEPELVLRRERLRDALATYDAATIATTHQFCQLVLRSLGVAGDTDAGATLVESLDDLVVEVVDDVYLRRFGHDLAKPAFDRDVALGLARAVVGDRQAELAPAAPGDAGSPGGVKVAFAQEVRDEVDRRKRTLGLLSYDDLLSRLAAALERDDAPARSRMRARWQVVLVDEFQDTDPVQWQVLDRAFSGHATMVLIGDPKQAIYAFRGGDVVTYLAAAETATTRTTLGTNWRADADLLERLQVVLRGAALGDPRIVVREVAAHHGGQRLQGAPEPASFRLRQVRRDGLKLVNGSIQIDEARRVIAGDCAGDIARTLTSGATWDGGPLEARHVAVLVGTRDHGLLVQTALAAHGVPAVLAGGGHVFSTAAGDHWLTLLQALEQPHRSGLVRAVALTPFIGETATGLDAGGDELTDRVAETLRGWALLLRARGVAALFEATEERGLTARVLATADGERLLTDLRHLAQLLHERATRDRLALTGLLRWVHEERRRDVRGERPRRLDSDAAAVQILTIHGSKGLEFPVVHLPFVFAAHDFTVSVARYHDGEVRMLDVRGAGEGWAAHEAAHRAEESGERLRNLYVALTRAQSQVVAWWAPTKSTGIGGLHRLLFGRQPGTAEVPAQVPVKDDDYAAHVLSLLEQLGSLHPEAAVPAGPTAEVPTADPGRLAVRRFGREVDADWRRTSYSGLIRVEETAAQLEGGVSSEPEVTAVTDEPDLADDVAESDGELGGDLGAAVAGTGLVSPMADLPAGATFGSLVHAVLETTDPAAPETGDLEAELRLRCAEQLRWWPVAATAEELATALVPMFRTPLGPLAGDLTLAAIPWGDRLRELDFEFALSGGDSRRARRSQLRLRDLGPLLRERLRDDDPLAPYSSRLEQPALGDQLLRGYLSGSVDVVLRVPVDGAQRFLVVDYKTNLLGEPGTPATTSDYTPERLAEAMLHSHYPLQALLYSVTLHRFLRWRLPGYDPATHLGGTLYLYLRGMVGADGPPGSGVFSWHPPADLVVALSDLLDASDPDASDPDDTMVVGR